MPPGPGREPESASHALDLEKGRPSLRCRRTGERMHSWLGAREEAQAIYAGPARLTARRAETGRELVLYDMGLGAGANAIAALEAWRGPTPRSLHLLSFENAPDGLDLALRHPEHFPYLQPWRQAVTTLLERGSWLSPDGSLLWELRTGDFRAQLRDPSRPAPDLVFYDFYSPRSAPELWTADCFAPLLKDRETRVVTLFTYSASTSARAAMLRAGFFVGRGRATSEKTETTHASSDPSALERPLGAAWLANKAPELRAALQEHPQFAR